MPIAAGGALDITVWMLAERLQAGLDQPFEVGNRAGAGGNIGSHHVAQSPADGHALMLAAASG